MPAIRALDVENFRCFKRLRVEDFTSVNLFVGANNSGKTALLEAIEAVVSAESPFILYRASLDRGESREAPVGRDDDGVAVEVRHWFHGSALEAGARFTIRAAAERDLSVTRILERMPDDAPSPPFVPGGLGLKTERTGVRNRLPVLPLMADGYLGVGSPSMFLGFGTRLRPPVEFVETHRRLPPDLVPLWAGVVLTPREETTVTALRLVEPAIERIAVSGAGDAARVQVLLRGASGPVPLGTLGEGVSRVLALALHLAAAQGGYLLVDEIESGLHWSVMPRVWRFLVETARALDVQVFATTHSKDCLEALAGLDREHPDLAGRVCVQRIEAGRETAVRFGSGRMAEYLDLDLETR